MIREKLIVLRKWKEPEVRVYMSNDEIGIEMDSKAYLASLVAAITNIPFTMTKAQLLTKLEEAHLDIVSTMKQTTVQII